MFAIVSAVARRLWLVLALIALDVVVVLAVVVSSPSPASAGTKAFVIGATCFGYGCGAVILVVAVRQIRRMRDDSSLRPRYRGSVAMFCSFRQEVAGAGAFFALATITVGGCWLFGAKTAWTVTLFWVFAALTQVFVIRIGMGAWLAYRTELRSYRSMVAIEDSQADS